MSAAASPPLATRADPVDATVADGALVDRLGGSPAALAELYRRHGGRVFASAKVVVGDDGRAGDITQEVFLRLWRNPQRFDPSRGSLVSFLCLQARRQAIDVLGDQARDRRPAPFACGRSRPVADGAPWGGTWGAHVRSAAASLDALERAPIELAFFGGYSYREVAALLDQPVGRVIRRIRSGLRTLGSALGGPGARRDD